MLSMIVIYDQFKDPNDTPEKISKKSKKISNDPLNRALDEERRKGHGPDGEPGDDRGV